MAVPIAYDDVLVVALNITNGIVDKMKIDTRLNATEVGYFTEMNRLYDASENIPARLMNQCMHVLLGTMAKLSG